MFNLNLIYKFPFLSKNKYLLDLAIKNMFNLLPDLKFVIDKNQNPLTKFYFFHMNTLDLTDSPSIHLDENRLKLKDILISKIKMITTQFQGE